MTDDFHPPLCILALDLGTTTGWALRGDNGIITSGTVSFRPATFTHAKLASAIRANGPYRPLMRHQ
jgi:hypothetical protein